MKDAIMMARTDTIRIHSDGSKHSSCMWLLESSKTLRIKNTAGPKSKSINIKEEVLVILGCILLSISIMLVSMLLTNNSAPHG